MPRDLTRQIQYFSDDEIRKILKEDNYNDEENYLFVLLLAVTGAHVTEVMSLKVSDLIEDGINTGNGFLQIYTKKHERFRTLPITKNIYSKLDNYIKSKNLKSDEYIFNIKYRTAVYRFNKVCLKHNIPIEKRMLSTLRHSWGIRAASNRLPSHIIKNCMGYKSMEDVELYLTIADEGSRDLLLKICDI